MKSPSAQIAAAILLATALAGCASEPTSSDTFSQLEVNLIVGNTDVTAVSFNLVCDGGFMLSGQFNVNDEQDPPIWSVIMDVPVGDCSLTLTAFDDQGAPLCMGGPKDFTVVEGETVKVNMVLTCDVDGGDPLGNVEVDATFEEVEANNCPRLHLLNAVPDEVPAEGTAVTVLVSDKDGDVLTTALTATGGSFKDPTAQSTTYTCDDASGSQTMFVTVSDGEAACDKSTSFDVTCPGVNLCEGVVCEDDGNVCTDAECNPENGQCESSNNTNECSAGAAELAVNGGFETGNLDGWTVFCDGPNNGSCEATDTEANGGSYSGRVLTAGAPANPLIKQANVGVGLVEANSEITISFDVKGSAGPGGVVFAELISEFSGGGGTVENLATFGPPSEWTNLTFTTNTGGDVGGGVTLQLVAVCGAVQDCIVDVYFDNVSIVYGSGGGAGTCSEGVCVPDAECSAPGECPDDGNECTDAVCDAGTCGTSNNTNVCDGGNGTCSAGVCEPNDEAFYKQDFNQLDINGDFIGDGWKFFNNVFTGDNTYKFGYGGTAAPNGPQISALVEGQGGAEQEPQQLSVYSDYECCGADEGHRNGTDLVEVNVFQERTIGADDVGKTFTFTFDAKATPPPFGVAGNTTANGFIKTLVPGPFNESAADREDTTNLPDTWGSFTVSLVVDGTTVAIGHILQFGFQTISSNEEPSGNYYDNVLVTLE